MRPDHPLMPDAGVSRKTPLLLRCWLSQGWSRGPPTLRAGVEEEQQGFGEMGLSSVPAVNSKSLLTQCSLYWGVCNPLHIIQSTGVWEIYPSYRLYLHLLQKINKLIFTPASHED